MREQYRQMMAEFTADDLVFLDESIFNEKTGWWHYAYAPVGHGSRYFQSQGYFNYEEFIEWICKSLLPTLRTTYGNRPKVIVLNNVLIH
ncbi:hypothetical protein P154DRAFT_590681 [Amniculicola lignicola CBS 123094]|uniref:Tc1-like transposase DDE domain-containing protein n=1 Tax=Amniculicola lignicola CBS 123094 TaxID=1392246 RepID=A0A6A5WRC1_9PLEO|nr:hypothetical protein P154DRAFT_590681 [Amniculicola lignicola CBS 123094]